MKEGRLSLFRGPFHKDWTVLLALAAVATNSYNIGITFADGANQGTSTLDVVFAVAIGAPITAAVLGIVPASIRRRRAKRKGSQRIDFTPLPTSRFWGLVVLVAGCAALATIYGPASEGDDASAEVRSSKCAPKGEDTLCVTVTAEESDSLRISSTWTYSKDKAFGDALIHEWRWSAIVNCKARQGSLRSLSGFDRRGVAVKLSGDAFEAIWDGVQTDQVDRIASEGCNRR